MTTKTDIISLSKSRRRQVLGVAADFFNTTKTELSPLTPGKFQTQLATQEQKLRELRSVEDRATGTGTDASLPERVERAVRAEVVDETTRRLITRVVGGGEMKQEDVLEKAAIQGDVSLVRKHLILLAEEELAVLRAAKRSLLHYACENGHLALVVLLIAEFGFQPQRVWPGKGPALHRAAQHGHTAVVSYLVTFDDHISGLNVKEERTGHTPLHYAVEGGWICCVEVLVEAGALIDQPDASGESPFLLACRLSDSQIATFLLQRFPRRIDINRLNKSNLGPVQYAVVNGMMQVLQLLAKNGAKLDNPRSYWSLLQLAARKENHEEALAFTRYLVEECGLKMGPCDAHHPPLNFALAQGNTPLVEYLTDVCGTEDRMA